MSYFDELTEVNQLLAENTKTIQDLITELAILRREQEELRQEHNRLAEHYTLAKIMEREKEGVADEQ